MRRTVLLLVLLAIFATLATAEAQLDMRMSTQVDNMVGAAGDTPEARLLFSHDGGELCVVIAIPAGPKALRAPLFRFMRRVAGEHRLVRLKIPLPAKPERSVRHGDRIHVWQGCLPVEDDAAEAGAVIDVQYRDPRLLKEPAEHAVTFPGPETPRGVDMLKDSAGNLLFQDFKPGADQAL